LLYVLQALTFRNSVFFPQRIYVFSMDIITNSDYFSLQHQLIGLYNRGTVCLLCGTEWFFNSNRYSFVLNP